MKNIILKLTALTLLLTSLSALAHVNLLEGSFRHTEKNIISTASRDRAFEILRSYSSRSNDVGLFGQGWCSNIETKLIQISSTSIEIHYCPHQSKIKFTLQPQMRPLQRFLSMLQENDPAPSDQQNVYSSEGSNQGYLTLSSQGWSWSREDGSWIRFFKDGRVKEETSKEGRFIQYLYNSEKKMNGIIIDKRLHLRIEYLKNSSLVSSIFEVNSLKSSYKIMFTYAGRSLVQVETSPDHFTLYSYDDLDNLRRIQNSKTGATQLTYDDQDRIESIQREYCIERFNYQTPEKSLARVLHSKSCESQQEIVQSFDFIFTDSDAQKTLQRVDITQNKNVKRIHFHTQWGHPTLIEEGEERTYFIYNEQGQLLQRKLASQNAHSIYDPQGRLIELSFDTNQKLKLLYNEGDDYPHTILSPQLGRIKLSWSGNTVNVESLTPLQNSKQLKSLLSRALQNLRKDD